MGEVNASRADVARLFGRAGFGATSADLDLWTGKKYADLVEFLLTTPDPQTRLAQLDEAQRINLEQNAVYNIAECQRWWLERMRSSPWRLEERMTLFWHDHFATGYGPAPFARAMMIQNQSLRTHALGSVRDLLNAVTIDPAMLDWLNGSRNAVYSDGNRQVNENYAREFFELFTLGVMPQVYTETDIEQAARAFTGFYTYSSNPANNVGPNRSTFATGRHDRGTKRILGVVIGGPGTDEPNEYRHVTEIALSQAVAPYWFAFKLVQNFGYEPVVAGDDLMTGADPVVTAVASAFRINNWQIKPAVRAMLMHDGWRYAERRRVRMPVELLVHAARVTGVNAGENTAPQLYTLAARMGQAVFQPPNVSGWPNGKSWLSQSRMLARYDLGQQIFNKWLTRNSSPAPADIDGWVALVGLDSISVHTRAAISAFLTARATAAEAIKKAGVLSLLLCSPDWQVM